MIPWAMTAKTELLQKGTWDKIFELEINHQMGGDQWAIIPSRSILDAAAVGQKNQESIPPVWQKEDFSEYVR